MPITELRIEGLRTIEKVRLPLDGLTVLIGDNGTGKSSILEACEILRRATDRNFMKALYGIHGGLTALLRQGKSRIVLGVTIQPTQGEYGFNSSWPESVEYDLVLEDDQVFATIEEVIRLRQRAEDSSVQMPRGASKAAKTPTARLPKRPEVALKRRAAHVDLRGSGLKTTIDDEVPFIATKDDEIDWGGTGGDGEAQIVAHYLREALVHLPFETIPAWAARALDRKSALRTSSLLTPADHLDKLGLNLASSYHALKNNFGRAHWDKTLEYIRLGLGERIEDIVTWVDPGGGNIGISVKLAGLDRPIPSAQLSDGMLSYLAFVALFRLHTTKPSLVAFDEPDLHLHPQLLMRVLDMFESMAREHPVILATHSDRLLDGLSDPAKSVVLCELDERGATRLVRPDAEALAKWLERYRGLGDIRGAGHAASVLTKVEPAG
ncbi:MAG: AAA family ATPase [Minicystis sp.]